MGGCSVGDQWSMGAEFGGCGDNGLIVVAMTMSLALVLGSARQLQQAISLRRREAGALRLCPKRQPRGRLAGMMYGRPRRPRLP